MIFNDSETFAQEKDLNDSLSSFKNMYFIPKVNEKTSIYLTGNSLGLQPKSTEMALKVELEDWKNLGVDGHFHGKKPWLHYHKFLTEKAAKIVGAKEDEVVIMNQLTSNLHFLFMSFYRPSKTRNKIIMEVGAFPSDMYLVESQVKLHGFNPEDTIIEVKPRNGEYSIRHEDIISAIENNKDSLALVFFSGVQYYTGQVFNIKDITKKAHACGAIAGFDLAHAAGNLVLHLHDWAVDFAAWCTYKYLNSGPGGVAGVFIHEKHGNNPELFRLAGWWGHNEAERFKMLKGFVPEKGAAGWQLSNAPVLSMAVHNAALEIFDQTDMETLHKKGLELNAYLQFWVEKAMEKNPKIKLEIITPAFPERSCQLSLMTNDDGKNLFDYLTQNGVIADWRNPNVIRMAPVPMYNSFEDIYRLGQLMLNY